jgi:hypothetical protein
LGLKKPPYSSSRAWGRSQWNKVMYGCSPASICRIKLMWMFESKEKFYFFLPFDRSSFIRFL